MGSKPRSSSLAFWQPTVTAGVATSETPPSSPSLAMALRRRTRYWQAEQWPIDSDLDALKLPSGRVPVFDESHHPAPAVCGPPEGARDEPRSTGPHLQLSQHR